LGPVDFINTYLIIGIILELTSRQINSYKYSCWRGYLGSSGSFSFILALILGVERENMGQQLVAIKRDKR